MDKTITPAEICRKSEMMYFFVNGFDMSRILVTVLRGHINTSQVPRAVSVACFELILQKNVS